MIRYIRPEVTVVSLSCENVLLESSDIPVGGGGTTHAPIADSIEDDEE